MTWQETVNKHDLWAALQQVRELCQSDGWPDDADVRDVVSRAAWLCGHIEGRKDANCITADSLNIALSAMQHIHASLTGLRADPPAAVPDNVRTAIEQALVGIAAWPAPDAAQVSQAVREGIEQQQKMANDALENLRTEVANIQTQVAAQQEQWKADAAAEIEAATAANAKLQAQVMEAATELATQKQRLDAALNDFATKSQAAEKERDAAEAAALKAREEAAQEQSNAQKKTAEERAAKMDGLLEQARKTLQTIGKEASASHYGTYADEQRKAAFGWSIGVLVALTAAAGFLIWAAIEHADTWHSAAARYALGAVFVGAATYAGKQSAFHRALERQARQRELAIGALGSFLADVSPPAAVQTLKLGVAADLFIDGCGPDPAKAGYQSPGAQIVVAVRDALGKSAETASANEG